MGHLTIAGPMSGFGLRLRHRFATSRAWLLSLAFSIIPISSGFSKEIQNRPNVLLILADDLGWGDLGCYGQTKIKTPNLDRLAKDGVRFTQAYAGSTVCAPSRCALMTGLHTGHCRTRGNGGGGSPRANVPLAPGDVCVAELLKKAGYATALVGKWGLGEEGSTGIPTKKGFDHFFGYLNQHHAHNYYPDFLWRNETKVEVPNPQSKVENVAAYPVAYAPDLLLANAVHFIKDHKSKPFFLYFATIAPHANNEKTRATGEGSEVPSDEPYSKEPWPQPEKNKAAMITRLDADVGTLLTALKDHGLETNTVVIFTSDNGTHQEGGNKVECFASSGTYRGFKRSMTDGGIRVPAIVRWPGRVKPGSVSDHVWAFWDHCRPPATWPGSRPRASTGFRSPRLSPAGEQKVHEFLYWEFHEGGTKQAVRHGNWKAIRPAPSRPLRTLRPGDGPGRNGMWPRDHGCRRKDRRYLKTARTESKEFPVQEPQKEPKKK